MEVKVEFGLLGADNLSEVLPAELVAILKLSIVIRLLLYGIVCQVDKLVCHVIKGILTAARPNVPILVAVALQAPIDTRQQSEAAKVKLALMNQQRVVNVLLNNKGAVILFAWPADDGLHFANCLHHSNALASVRVFTWLDDPGVLWSPVFFVDFFYSVLVICVYLTGIILILSFLFVFCLLLISVILLDSLLSLFLAGAMPLLHLVVIILELSELRVVNALLRVESQWEHLEGVLAE